MPFQSWVWSPRYHRHSHFHWSQVCTYSSISATCDTEVRRWSRWNGLGMADSLFLCDGGGIFNGRAGVVNAVNIFVTFRHTVTWDLTCAFSPRTSAGLYYFSAKLAPPKYSALASWITGWENILSNRHLSHHGLSRMGQYHGPSHSRVFHRLYMVR